MCCGFHTKFRWSKFYQFSSTFSQFRMAVPQSLFSLSILLSISHPILNKIQERWTPWFCTLQEPVTKNFEILSSQTYVKTSGYQFYIGTAQLNDKEAHLRFLGYQVVSLPLGVYKFKFSIAFKYFAFFKYGQQF